MAQSFSFILALLLFLRAACCERGRRGKRRI